MRVIISSFEGITQLFQGECVVIDDIKNMRNINISDVEYLIIVKNTGYIHENLDSIMEYGKNIPLLFLNKGIKGQLLSLLMEQNSVKFTIVSGMYYFDELKIDDIVTLHVGIDSLKLQELEMLFNTDKVSLVKSNNYTSEVINSTKNILNYINGVLDRNVINNNFKSSILINVMDEYMRMFGMHTIEIKLLSELLLCINDKKSRNYISGYTYKNMENRFEGYYSLMTSEFTKNQPLIKYMVNIISNKIDIDINQLKLIFQEYE